MVVDDWSICPACKFPSLFSEASEWVSKFGSCCMCDQPLTRQQITAIPEPDAKELLKGDGGEVEKKEEGEEEAKGTAWGH